MRLFSISFPAGKADERQASGFAMKPWGTAVCVETEVQRGQDTGEIREVSCQLGNRGEGTDGFSSKGTTGLSLLPDLLPAGLPALGRALEHHGHRLKPTRGQHSGYRFPWLQGCLAYLPRYRETRGPAKKGRACMCARGTQSNTSPRPKPQESGRACHWERGCSSVGWGTRREEELEEVCIAVLQLQSS